MKTPELHEVGSPGATKLIQALLDEPAVAFVGSGVSIWEPSRMPTGQDFTASLFSLLFESCFAMQADEHSIISQLFNEMPFEHILEVCPNPVAAAELILALYGKDIPNPIHQGLAKALRKGIITSLITTNYDCCIESALKQTIGPPVHKVVTDEDWSRVSDSSTLYFKIHGSSETGLEQTVIRTMAEECLLPPWKRTALERLLRGKTVVFVGYSGRDFELCPEIERLSPGRIVWITRSPSPPSVNANALMQKIESYVLYGDLNVILGQWLGSAPAVLTKDMAVATRRAIQDRFTCDQFVEWRLAILIRIGAPILAERTLNSARHIDPIVSLRQRAHTDINAGRAHNAARHFLQASLSLYRSYGHGSVADVLLDACDAYRIYGAMVRAWLTFLCAALLHHEKNRAKMFLKLGLLIFAVHGFVRQKFLKRWLRNRAVVVLKKCATESLKTGNWLDFQQAGLLARRMGIELTELSEEHFYPPPDPREGYLKLGYFLAQSMMVLEDLESHPPESRSDVERNELSQTLLRQLRFCDVLGIVPQAWKLRAAGRKYLDLDPQAEIQYIKVMIDDFRSCQFRYTMRRYWLRRFPYLKTALRTRQ